MVLFGACTSEKTLKNTRAIFTHTTVLNNLGMTEVVGAAAAFDFSSLRDNSFINSKPGTSGRPVPGIWYKVNTISHMIFFQTSGNVFAGSGY